MKKSNKKLAKVFSLTSCYIGNLISTINPRLEQSSKISIKGNLCSLRNQSREILCHTWITDCTYQMVTWFPQFMTRGMHLISLLSIFLTYL